MARVGEGAGAITVTAELSARAGLRASAAVSGVRAQVAAPVGTALLVRGAGLVGRAAAAAVDTLQPAAVVPARAAVGAVGQQILAAVVAATVAVRTGRHRVAAAATGPVGALVRAVGRTGETAAAAVVEIRPRVDADPDMGAAGFAVPADRVVPWTAFALAEPVDTHSTASTAGVAIPIATQAIDTDLVFAAGRVAPLRAPIAVATHDPKGEHHYE